jgi:hypothetical protein
MLLFVLVILLILVFVLTFFAFSSLVAFLFTGVPFVTTNTEDIKFIVDKLSIFNADTFYDLGSGDGKVVFLVEKLTGAKVKGFELGWWAVIFSKIKVVLIGSKAKFVNGNFFKHNWSDASFIYCYLFPPLMGRVEEKFKADMKPGSVAIIRDFPFPNMKPLDKYSLPKGHTLFIYKL